MPALPGAATAGYKLDRKAKQVLAHPAGYGARQGKMDDKYQANKYSFGHEQRKSWKPRDRASHNIGNVINDQ